MGRQLGWMDETDTLAVLLNGDITITGDHRTAGARGEIVLLEGVYYKDVKINLLQMATSRQRAVAPASEPSAIPYFDTVDLNIAESINSEYRELPAQDSIQKEGNAYLSREFPNLDYVKKAVIVGETAAEGQNGSGTAAD